MDIEKEIKEQKFLIKLLMRKVKRLEKSIEKFEVKNGRAKKEKERFIGV